MKPSGSLFSLSKYQLDQDDAPPFEDLSLAPLTIASRRREEEDSRLPTSGCVTCGVSFDDGEEQRQHFRCDWHRYNVKMRVIGKAVVREDEFDAMVDEDDVASISGSEDEASDDDDDDEEASGSRRDGSLAPYCIFRVVADGVPRSVAFWKCLSVPDALSKQTVTTSETYHAVSDAMRSTQQWAVIMLQGGHFASAVYEVSPPSDKVLADDAKAHEDVAELAMKEVRHKSFHRYVVRAKAGGKQSDKDATGKFAKSAGSRLRRYNEAVLKQEIIETLTEWKSVLDACSMVFLSCPGSNRMVLLDKDSPLDKADPRLRRIPFVVRRPTISETKRVIKSMLTVYVLDHADDDAAEAQRKKEARALKESAALAEQARREEQRQAAKLELQRQEEINKAKNREKKQRQKDRRKLQSQQEQAAAGGAAAGAGEAELDLDAQLKLLAATVGAKAKEKAKEKDKKEQKGMAPKQAQSKARALKPDDAAARREKLAEAAERRAAALAAASSSQKFH